MDILETFVDNENNTGIRYNEIPQMGQILSAFRQDFEGGAIFLAELLCDECREVELIIPPRFSRNVRIEDLPFINVNDVLNQRRAYGIRVKHELVDATTRYYLATEVPSDIYLEALSNKGYTRPETLLLLGLHIADRSLYAYIELQEQIASALTDPKGNKYVHRTLIETLLPRLTATHFDRLRKSLQEASVDGADIAYITSIPTFQKLSEKLSQEQFRKDLN